MNQQGQGDIDTRKVLVVSKKDRPKQQTIYFPCYVRFLFKEISSVDQQAIEAQFSGTLLFSFYYGNVERKLLDMFINQESKAILLEFNQEESIQLIPGKDITITQDSVKKLIHFKVRKLFKADLKGKLFLAPFVIIDIYFLVTVQSTQFTYNNILTTVKFNCMDNQSIVLLNHGQNLSFSHYQLAPFYFRTIYTNIRKYPFQSDDTIIDNTDQEENKDLKYYQYAHFKISVFQYPQNTILVVFIPLWFLGFIGFLTFFQEQSFGARLATIAVLVLAYVPLISTINQKIPPSPKIKLIEYFIVLQLVATILLLIQSFTIKDLNPYVFEWETCGYFWAYVIINLLTFFVMFSLLIIHRTVWVPRYVKKNPLDINRKKSSKIDLEQWSNNKCDEQFTAYKQNDRQKKLTIKQYK